MATLPTERPVTPLRQRMLDDMAMRAMRSRTQHDYVRHVRTFAAFLGRSPDTATAEDVRCFQLHQREHGVGESVINGAVSALRFLFDVLSVEEVAKLLEAAPGIKYRAALGVAYGAGLRVSEVAHLKATLAHAHANVPHYARAFAAAGVAPDDLRSLDDIARLPFTTKADLRANYPLGMFAVPMDRVARIHASSGTTGQPTVVGYTAEDIATWGKLVARSIHAGGGRPGMKVHIAYGYGLFTGGLGAHYGAEALGCAVIPMSGGQTERQVQLIGDFAPEVIMATPSYMLAILDEFRRQGIDPRGSSLRYGIFGAEPWTEAMRAEIEQAFGIAATDIYGLSEVMGPGVAQEIVGGARGPTIWEDHFLPEIVDPATGAVLPDGEEGELVFTSLTKQAFPVIRYRTRDLTRLLPGVDTPMRRIAKITGRSDDMLIIRGVNVFPTQIEEQLLKCDALAPHFMMEIIRPDRLDLVSIDVERRDGGEEAVALHEARLLEGYIKDRVGITVTARICESGTLPRSIGKLDRVRDLRHRR